MSRPDSQISLRQRVAANGTTRIPEQYCIGFGWGTEQTAGVGTAVAALDRFQRCVYSPAPSQLLTTIQPHISRNRCRAFCRGRVLARKQEPFPHVDWTPPIPVLDADAVGQRMPETEPQVAEPR